MHHLPRLDGGDALHGPLRPHVLRGLPRRLAAQEAHLPHLPVSPEHCIKTLGVLAVPV